MELPVEVPSLSSLNSRDLKERKLVHVPATTMAMVTQTPPPPATVTTNAWLTPPDLIKQHVKALNFEKERQVGQQEQTNFSRKPREWKHQPYNIYTSVLSLVHVGCVQGAASLEESCLEDLGNCIKEEKRAAVIAVNCRIQAAKNAMGRRNLNHRGARWLVCLLITIYWGSSSSVLTLTSVSTQILMLILAADLLKWTFNHNSIFLDLDWGRDKLDQHQLEINSFLRLINEPVNLKPPDTNNLSYHDRIFFCLDIILQIFQLSLLLSAIIATCTHWKPLSTGVSSSQLLIYLLFLALHGCVAWLLLSAKEERNIMESEEDVLSLQLTHLSCTTFDEKTNTYQFADIDDIKFDNGTTTTIGISSTTTSKSLITRTMADCQVYEWSFLNTNLNKTALLALKQKRFEFQKAVWKSKFNALGKKITEIAQHVTSSSCEGGGGGGEGRALNFYSDVFYSNQKGFCLCYFALLDLFEDDNDGGRAGASLIDGSDRQAYAQLMVTMREVEGMEMQRMRRLVHSKSRMGSPERYNQLLYFVTSKRILFHREEQIEVFLMVRDYLIRYSLQNIKMQCELPLSSPEEGERRLTHLTCLLDEAELDKKRSQDNHEDKEVEIEVEVASAQERNSESLSKVKRALGQLRHHVALLRVNVEREAQETIERSKAIPGPRVPHLRATPRYYHPSMFRERKGGEGVEGCWDCCGKTQQDSVGCRVEYIQKGRVLQVYHHPLPWREEGEGIMCGGRGAGGGGVYECCLQEDRSSRGCVGGFHPSHGGSGSR